MPGGDRSAAPGHRGHRRSHPAAVRARCRADQPGARPTSEGSPEHGQPRAGRSVAALRDRPRPPGTGADRITPGQDRTSIIYYTILHLTCQGSDTVATAVGCRRARGESRGAGTESATAPAPSRSPTCAAPAFVPRWSPPSPPTPPLTGPPPRDSSSSPCPGPTPPCSSASARSHRQGTATCEEAGGTQAGHMEGLAGGGHAPAVRGDARADRRPAAEHRRVPPIPPTDHGYWPASVSHVGVRLDEQDLFSE